MFKSFINRSVMTGLRRLCSNPSSTNTGNLHPLIRSIENKYQIILENSTNDRYETACNNSFLEYAKQSLLMESIQPDQKSINSIVRGTDVMNGLELGHVTVQDICRVHENLMVECDPAIAGHIRTVSVGIRCPPKKGQTQSYFRLCPDPIDVPLLMDKLIALLNDSSSGHPLIHAALSKLMFVFIHPFEDGNGRVSRIIFNGILNKHGYPFTAIPVEENYEYYASIEAYQDDSNHEPCVRYLLRCVDRSLQSFLDDVKLST